jgi:hypothetical protein
MNELSLDDELKLIVNEDLSFSYKGEFMEEIKL